jgi:hypothetical protein
MKNDVLAQAISKDIYAKKNYLYSVISEVEVQPTGSGQGIIVYAGKDEPKVKLYLMGVKLHKLLTGFFQLNGDIFDPMCGNLIHLTKMINGTSDPKFAQTFATPHPAKCKLEPKLLALMDNLPDLSKVYEPMTYANAKNAIDIKLATFRTSRPSPNQVMNVPQNNMMQQPNNPVQSSPIPSAQTGPSRPVQVVATQQDIEKYEEEMAKKYGTTKMG